MTELPKKYWGIFKNGKYVTTGSDFAVTIEYLEDLNKGYQGIIHYSDVSLAPKRELGKNLILGMTWEEIKAKQQKQ